MISYEKFFLSNGLEVIVHTDPIAPIVCLNTLYKVGSRNEDPDMTGLAHLFEHLMFGGSKNIPAFDEPLQAVGGDNNAFTNEDITNYYTTVPSNNVETAFWLESDRMLELSFDPEVLEVQRNVVIEEFKQRYLNQPYGDIWLKLRPEVYNIHPYRWPTIGKEISHIEAVQMSDVKDFFEKYYAPSNAILVIAGDISFDNAKELTEKWFGPISGIQYNYPKPQIEPKQTQEKKIEIFGEVPHNAIYKVYHMPARYDKSYYAVDLLCDVLGRGKSSMLYEKLVKRKPIFSNISAFVTGNDDPGLLVINGKLNNDITLEEADLQIDSIISSLSKSDLTSSIEKVKNIAESAMIFGEVELLNRAMNLAYSTFMGDTSLVNYEMDLVRNVTQEEIKEQVRKIFISENSTTLYYRKN